MAKTAHELLAELSEHFWKFREEQNERTALIKEIEELISAAQAQAEREGDWQLMNKATMLNARITHVLDTSNEEVDELLDGIAEIINEKTVDQGGLDETPETITTLERMLAKTKYSSEVGSTLRDALKAILQDAKN